MLVYMNFRFAGCFYHSNNCFFCDLYHQIFPRSKWQPYLRGVGMMIEGNISKNRSKKQSLLFYCLDILKIYQRETKFFELSRDTNRQEKNHDMINNVTLQWLRCHRCRFSRSLMFTKKSTIFLENGLCQKISAICQGLPMEMQHYLQELASAGIYPRNFDVY